jgi:hypothetical protein
LSITRRRSEEMAPFDEVDLELIGALLDGRLTGAERERAIKLLGESEAAFEVYTDALRARADLEKDEKDEEDDEDEQKEDNPVIPFDKWRSRKAFAWPAIGSAAAAAVVMIALIPSLRARRDRNDLNAPASQITVALARRPDLGRTLMGQWDQRTWSVTRGGSSQLVDSTVSFRLGVRVVDLNLAIAAGDTVRAGRLTGEIIESLDQLQLSDAVKADYAGLRAELAAGAAKTRLTEVASQAETGLAELAWPFWFGFGRWVGGGELAARTRTADFFDESLTKRFLTLAAERRELSPSDADLLGQIAVLAGNGVTGAEFDTIQQHFQTLIRRHGG